jgi:mannose-6-phosphate isomerase class I
VLGKHAELFGPYFPIRFDFLDTFEGGNLSIQCHPSRKYISENFGETITQDETYYILDCAPDARVYLGFQEDIDPAAFRAALEYSQDNKEKLEVEKYVQNFPSHKHDLFLIPNGTVHSSGVNNMVLEISATPYIFTFKMYDWLSLDLNGNPRPINIDHAFNNLRFERKGEVVAREHISHPVSIGRGADWELIHLPTHREHFYDVHRIEFDSEVMIDTNESCHVLMLVEGTSVAVEIDGQPAGNFAYAETFIISAAAKRYKLVNKGRGMAKVIKSFLKDEIILF